MFCHGGMSADSQSIDIFMVLRLLGRLRHPFCFWLELDSVCWLCSLVSSPNPTEPHALVHIPDYCILPWV